MVQIIERLDRLERLILQQSKNHKDLLDINEASDFLNLSVSQLYKHSSNSEITFYKPMGKKIYFRREDLLEWALKNRSPSKEEIEQEAKDFKVKKGGVEL
jgi:excisionase family DNA binding protein